MNIADDHRIQEAIAELEYAAMDRAWATGFSQPGESQRQTECYKELYAAVKAWAASASPDELSQS